LDGALDPKAILLVFTGVLFKKKGMYEPTFVEEFLKAQKS